MISLATIGAASATITGTLTVRCVQHRYLKQPALELEDAQGVRVLLAFTDELALHGFCLAVLRAAGRPGAIIRLDEQTGASK